MLDVEGRTIGSAFVDASQRFSSNVFMRLPADLDRDYAPTGQDVTFAQAKDRVDHLTSLLVSAGYGAGARIAVLLENRPDMLLLKLACNNLGISWVPVNPDYRPGELAYVLTDSAVALAVVLPKHAALMKEAIAETERTIPCAIWEEHSPTLPASQDGSRPTVGAPDTASPGPETEASLLYTSGTTGKPKGCIISHEYELMMGAWYATRGGAMALQIGAERVYNPLPLFHVNAGIVGFYGMMLTGNCMVIPERFSRTRWWRDIRETGATGCHYLGVVIPVLMNEPASELDRQHTLRWGFGAGVEPTLHRPFEERFGFPLIEGWGMTEACRILVDSDAPRQVDTRAIGRPQPTLEIRVVDQDDVDVPAGESGEMVVRHSAETPRKGAFSGYLNQPEATEQAWRGGWFHTGDTVRQDETGMIHFVDRKKNIIRRSGENIAAAEVEAILQPLDQVSQVAIVAIEDEMRDEEVLAAIVPTDRSAAKDTAQIIFDACYKQLAYYKAPGWIVFVDKLPVTGTQKILKHMIFDPGIDPRELPNAHDLRSQKVRR